MAQLALSRNPRLGELIPGGAGLRKVRWELQGRGKSGGARVIYYWAAAPGVIVLLYIYAKNERDDLSRNQLKALANAVREEFR